MGSLRVSSQGGGAGCGEGDRGGAWAGVIMEQAVRVVGG